MYDSRLLSDTTTKTTKLTHRSNTMEKTIKRKPFVPKSTGMSSMIKRESGAVDSGSEERDLDKEYEEYKLQTRGEYEDLMMEFEFRCKRAAMMHYYEASGYNRKTYHTELIAVCLGTVSVSSISLYLFKKQDFSFSHLGTLGALGLGVALILELAGKSSSRLLPSFKNRAEAHVAAAAAWQRLAMKTRSYRIQLDNPKLDVSTYALWYDDIIKQREALCIAAIVPQSTYKLFSDPERVYIPMKKRRQLYLKFLELEESSTDDFDKHDII